MKSVFERAAIRIGVSGWLPKPLACFDSRISSTTRTSAPCGKIFESGIALFMRSAGDPSASRKSVVTMVRLTGQRITHRAKRRSCRAIGVVVWACFATSRCP